MPGAHKDWLPSLFLPTLMCRHKWSDIIQNTWISGWVGGALGFILTLIVETEGKAVLSQLQWVILIDLLILGYLYTLVRNLSWSWHVILLMVYFRDPQPLDCGPLPVGGLLGTRMHSRRWVAGEWAKLHLPLPIARITPGTISPPSPPGTWKKCLPWNWSLVPKRHGTTGLLESAYSKFCSVVWKWDWSIIIFVL